ncbi:MAG TPA: sulfotransferase, partial [Polyangiaceae bacterium]|nr:sulfotransferase [Polyangiaceae bacterium]
RVSLGSDEEDENLFVFSLTSPALYLLFPFVRELPEFTDFTRLGARALRRVAHDYRETVERWIYLGGDERTPLIKNVLLASRLPVSDRAFPEARYVHILRDPREAIPSAVSMFYAMWQVHSPGIAPDSAATRALADMFLAHYRVLCEEGRKRAGRRWITVRYETLVDDPVGTVERLYAELGFAFTPAFRARLEAEALEARRFKSRHRYELSHFGLSEGDLRAALGAELYASLTAPEGAPRDRARLDTA